MVWFVRLKFTEKIFCKCKQDELERSELIDQILVYGKHFTQTQ